MTLFAVAGLGVLGVVLTDIFRAVACWRLVKEVIVKRPDINYSGGIIPYSGKLVGDVEFKNVTFKYKTRDVDVLKDVSFKVSTGQAVALVGESGSGKSTIFSLLERIL